MTFNKKKRSALAKIILSTTIVFSIVSINSYAIEDEIESIDENSQVIDFICKILPQCKE
ncbi:MAG: hypothetical protein V7780_12155 [Colwellia sp.]|jgi:hypothetical protein|uniref:hypothetical protein n=1 Tax=Colwellia sp. Bg11-12 TaxID=2759817 RepID=UPI0015F646D0|nr:hypothetical protein [Colwellia sp. Bg11-12]MBA6263805.1 hypothetical protein [Colwellia sp. Bg11-12]